MNHHKVRHFRGGFDEGIQLTETEILINRIQTLETMLNAIDKIQWPGLYQRIETKLNNAKAELEAKRIIEWRDNEQEDLGRHTIISDGECLEL